MNQEPDIVLFTIPLCPKCAAAKRHIAEISMEHPELTIIELNMLTNIGAALRYGLLTAPAVLVRGKPLKGTVSIQTIMELLFDG
jgi:glutaredoxin